MKKRGFYGISLIILFLTAFFLSRDHLFAKKQDDSSKKSQVSENKTQANTPATGQSGYRVYIDPATGRFLDHPVGGGALQLTPELQNAVSTSGAGLQEVPAPGGGMMVDLQGRFQNVMSASEMANGKLNAPCLTGGINEKAQSKSQKNSVAVNKVGEGDQK